MNTGLTSLEYEFFRKQFEENSKTHIFFFRFVQFIFGGLMFISAVSSLLKKEFMDSVISLLFLILIIVGLNKFIDSLLKKDLRLFEAGDFQFCRATIYEKYDVRHRSSDGHGHHRHYYYNCGPTLESVKPISLMNYSQINVGEEIIVININGCYYGGKPVESSNSNTPYYM